MELQLVGFFAGEGPALEDHLAPLRRQDAAAQEEKGAFSRAVAAQDRHPLPFFHGEAQILHSQGAVGVGVGDAAQLQNRLIHPGSTPLTT